jgi:hypothetical protein
MNPPINITNYDKRRANSERRGNLGLADLSLKELKQYFLNDRKPWVFVNIPVDYCKSPQHFLPEVIDW